MQMGRIRQWSHGCARDRENAHALGINHDEHNVRQGVQTHTVEEEETDDVGGQA
jgi:hypothetical protein